jgi:hypothetical protein
MQDIRTTQSIEDSASQRFFIFSRDCSALELNLKLIIIIIIIIKLLNGIVIKTISSFF